MKRCNMLVLSLMVLGQLSGFTAETPKNESGGPIRHTVFFRLIHPEGSKQESDFLAAARKLAVIPTVRKFECLREVSKKNNFTFGLSMEFVDQAGYDSYNKHPDHVKFVREIWMKEVKEFMEIDFVVMDRP